MRLVHGFDRILIDWVGVSIQNNKPAKQQALQIIKQLMEKSSLKIERAKVIDLLMLDLMMDR